MTSQIANRISSPSGGALRGMWRDWVGGAVLMLVWTTLWTVFTAGVLAPASKLSRHGSAVGSAIEQPGVQRSAALRPAPPAGLAASAWVTAR